MGQDARTGVYRTVRTTTDRGREHVLLITLALNDTDNFALFQLVTLLGLSYKNTRELNAIIDGSLTSGRPRFIRREVVVADEVHEVFYRDIIECIRALYGDPEFADILVFSPEKHYADPEHQTRVYFDLHTGKWWWETQVRDSLSLNVSARV